MKLHKIALAVFLGAASMAASAADNATSQSPNASGSLSLANNRKEHESLRIVEPKAGELIADTTTVKAEISVGDGIRPKSLRIKLNGKNITRHAKQEDCGPHACRWTVELAKADRLLSGQNQLVVFARGAHDSIKVTSTKFGYYYGLGAGENQPNYVPSTVGLSLNAGGAQPWVSLTTGTPANLQDNLNPISYSLPFRDATFPTAKDTACTERYQVVVLNRRTPALEDAYFCDSDSTALKNDLAGLTQGAEIVLVGTTLYNNADPSLDTTSIGGTNYSSYPAAWQPRGYAAIGVSGAAPGSAYESYYLPGDVGKAYLTSPFANGLLAVDQYGNYNFHAGNNIQFEVYPNDPDGGTSFVFVADGKTIHGWNPPAGSNGFWLLILDRVTLLPIDASNADGSPCQPLSAAQTCGTFYPTGSTDSTTASQAAGNLHQALNLATNRQLVILTTVGQPFQSASVAADVVPIIDWYGGSGYTLESLTTPTSTYTLVAPGLQIATGLPGMLNPFSKGVVNSSSAFGQQGQTGIVRGVMARNNQSLYFPSVVSQDDGKGNAPGAGSVSIDYDFYTISTEAPIDWPLTDTPGHIAAYHYVSQQFLAYALNENGTYSADVRWFYPDSVKGPLIANANTDFDCSVNPNMPNCKYPGDGQGFTEQDLADANAQLYTEVTAFKDTYGYLGDPGIGGVIKGNGDGGMSDLIIDATYEVLNGQVGAVPSTSVKASTFDWMNLAAGLTSILGAALGPADLPIIAAAVGVTSGALWSGSALDPWWGSSASATPPSYENTFDTTLGDLQNKTTGYAEDLANSYGTALNNIYTDWGKLQATGAKTEDSNSGWSFSNELTSNNVAEQLSAGVRRSIYLQLVPQFYSQDTYTQQPVADLDQLGMFYSFYGGPLGDWYNSCNASYPSSIQSNAYRVYPSSSNVGTDMFVMGGTINFQGTNHVSESLPSNLLLNTLFNAPPVGDSSLTGPLNIPQDLLYGTAALTSRQGPNEGTYDGITQCYKPGCDDGGNPKNSKCINP